MTGFLLKLFMIIAPTSGMRYDDDDDDDAADTGSYNLRIFAASKRDGRMLVSASSDCCQLFIYILTTFSVHHSFTV